MAKIVLFGSLAKGEASPESDVDVLVFSFNGREALREACAEAAFEVAMETGEGIKPLVYPLSEYFRPRTYFTYRASRFGKEVFSVADSELKQREVRALRGLAEVYLAGTEGAFGAGDLRIAIVVCQPHFCGSLRPTISAIRPVGQLLAVALLVACMGPWPRRPFGPISINLTDHYAAQITDEMAQEVLNLARELIGHLRRMAGEAPAESPVVGGA
ncbi:MAG: nucleotidyltransferase domain-containing protein [Anaerolineae bacterium]